MRRIAIFCEKGDGEIFILDSNFCEGLVCTHEDIGGANMTDKRITLAQDNHERELAFDFIMLCLLSR